MADEWNTPDGMISVTVPDPTRFVEVKIGPEALVAWKSMDGNLVMAFAELANPKEERLRLSPVVEGFANEFRKTFKNVEILHSSVEQHSGHEVLVMTGRGEKEEFTAYSTQVITSTGGKVYKAMATGIGIDTRTDPDATAFIASFKPLVSRQGGATALVPAPVGQPVQMPPEPNAFVKIISNKLGFFAGMLLFAAFFVFVIVYLVRLSRSRDTDDDDERPIRRRRRRDDEDDEEERPKRRRRREEDD